ncbi:hypothetical protein Y032_0022g609 [Ancylostoma ceylanicum]|uniref:Uncharacterized protein n=1 Tax=Ancylostoma ceylanicum TaxID=53326 RepID=A0A016UYB3_9BILA|nr:hypothetical protein Y032_0022g609 [Ancylostoma ceylanicum]
MDAEVLDIEVVDDHGMAMDVIDNMASYPHAEAALESDTNIDESEIDRLVKDTIRDQEKKGNKVKEKLKSQGKMLELLKQEAIKQARDFKTGTPVFVSASHGPLPLEDASTKSPFEGEPWEKSTDGA